MKNKIKVTFKKGKKPSGLAAVGWGWRSDVKVKGKKCAIISGGQARSDRVNMQVAVKKEKTTQDPAPFRWIMVENNCKTEDEARNIVELAINEIVQENELHFFED